jgi:hypothetical protein
VLCKWVAKRIKVTRFLQARCVWWVVGVVPVSVAAASGTTHSSTGVGSASRCSQSQTSQGQPRAPPGQPGVLRVGGDRSRTVPILFTVVLVQSVSAFGSSRSSSNSVCHLGIAQPFHRGPTGSGSPSPSRAHAIGGVWGCNALRAVVSVTELTSTSMTSTPTHVNPFWHELGTSGKSLHLDFELIKQRARDRVTKPDLGKPPSTHRPAGVTDPAKFLVDRTGGNPPRTAQRTTRRVRLPGPMPPTQRRIL